MHLRFYKRPQGRPVLWDLTLLYMGSYALLGSNVPGVFLTWNKYIPCIEKMFKSEKMKKGGLINVMEFLDRSRIADYRLYYYFIDMRFNRFY